MTQLSPKEARELIERLRHCVTLEDASDGEQVATTLHRLAADEIQTLRDRLAAAEQALQANEDHCNNHCPGRQP